LVQLEQNCPDFAFVGFARYEAPEWATQYEEEDRLVVINAEGVRCVVDVEAEGDDALNRIFFEFLRGLLISPRTLEAIARVHVVPERLGVQLLDSEYGVCWKPR
jgi:cobalamin biosynthesis protein CbiG